MALLVTYDLQNYVTGTLQQEEVPASGVYLYANALVKENGKTMAEYAQGNNSTGVQLPHRRGDHAGHGPGQQRRRHHSGRDLAE